MNITLITHRFLPHHFGRVETYTLRLAQALQVQGHIIHILTGEPVSGPDRTIVPRHDEVEGVPVIRLVYDFLRFPVTSRAAYADPAFTAVIRAVLADRQPDIVHATSLSLLMGGTIEAAKSLNLPIIYTATDFVLTCRRGTYIKPNSSICIQHEEPALCTGCMGPQTALEGQLDRVYRLLPSGVASLVLPTLENLISKRADFVHAAASIEHRFRYLPYWREQIDHVVAPSSYAREMLLLNNFPTERITVSPYGIPRPHADFRKTSSSKIRFGYIGRITPIKGVHSLIDAFSRLNLQEQAELTLYGKADVDSDLYLQRLQEKVGNASHINFAGFVDNAQISKLYENIDVLVVPSLWPENSPITILEAQAHGIPVIASDIAGVRDLIEHERNGLLFTPQTIDDLANQLTRCLTSPGLLARLSRHSQIIRSIDEDCCDLISLYKELSQPL